MTPPLHQENRQQRLIGALQRILMILIGISVAVLVICLFTPEYRNRREQGAKVEKLKSQIDQQRSLLSIRNKQIELLKNDPSYLEVIARDKLDLMKEGETILRMDSRGTDNRMDPRKGQSR